MIAGAESSVAACCTERARARKVSSPERHASRSCHDCIDFVTTRGNRPGPPGSSG
jgi:hypothetical protein